MEERKPDKKPIIWYWAIAIVIFLLLNMFVFPRVMQHNVKEVGYDTFISMMENKEIGSVEVESSQITFTNKDETEYYKTGVLDDTGYVIGRRRDDSSLLDQIETALDLTLANAKKMFVLYDDFGKLTLKNIANMKIPNFLVYDGNTEDFKYTSSIDKQTYNKIVLMYNDSEKGARTPCVASDEANMDKWGVLQYFDESLTATENGKAKAEALLKLYNRKTKNLKLQGVVGNPNVRPGCLIPTLLDLGDVKLQNYMMVEEVTHHLYLDEHSMDLTLVGGGFIA